MATVRQFTGGSSTPGLGAADDVNSIRISIATTTPVVSTQAIPAGAIVHDTVVDIDSAYDPGTTITVGDSGTTDLLMASGGNDPTTPDQYTTETDIAWSSGEVLRVTIGGSPAAGSGTVTVRYSEPAS